MRYRTIIFNIRAREAIRFNSRVGQPARLSAPFHCYGPEMKEVLHLFVLTGRSRNRNQRMGVEYKVKGAALMFQYFSPVRKHGLEHMLHIWIVLSSNEVKLSNSKKKKAKIVSRRIQNPLARARISKQSILILQFARYHTNNYAHFFVHIPMFSAGELAPLLVV